MASNHSHSYKAYSGNNRTTLVFTILIYCLVQKLLSNGFLMLLWGNCLLCTVGFSCNTNNSGLQSATHAAASTSGSCRCIGTITTLGMGDPIKSWMVVYLDPLYEKSKWKQMIAKVRLLHDKGPIQNLLHTIAYNDHSSVRFKGIDAKTNLSADVAATDPIDEAIPNWKDYGITPFMLCQRSSFGNKPIFSLDLNGATFQNGEQLGFILVQNNSSPVDLVQYLLQKNRPWPDRPHSATSIKDYLILPGAIGKHILQSEPALDGMIDLDSYTTIYCYVKKGHHYCFIPLNLIRNHIAKWQFYGLPYSNKAEHPDIAPKNCASGIASPPYTSKSVATNPSPVKENNGLGQEIPNVATNEIPQSPKSSIIARKPVTPSDPEYARLEKKMNDIRIQQKTIPEILKGIKRLKRNQKISVKSIKSIKIIASNDAVNNTIRLGSVNEIQLALSPALKAIETLKSALTLENTYELGIAYSRPANLSDKRKAVIKTLNDLGKAVYEEYIEFESAEASLNQLIEHLETMYGILFNVFRIDEIDSMVYNVKQLFIGKRMKSKKEKARKIIEQLQDMTFNQQNAIQNFRKKVSEVQETLAAIQQKDLAPLIGHSKIVSAKTDLLDLKNKLRLSVNIIEGKVKDCKHIGDIIMDLKSAEKDIKAILNSVDLKTQKIEIAKKIEEAVNNALNLEKKFKIEIQSKSKEMVDQIEIFKKLLPKMKPYYDSGYEETLP